MTERDRAYLQGEQERGGEKNPLSRLWPFLKPHRKLVATAWGFMLLTVIFELSMPFITRVAIDDYLVPHYLQIKETALSEKMLRSLKAKSAKGDFFRSENFLYIRESLWRDADPSYKSKIRAQGLIGNEKWYALESHGEQQELLRRNSGLFKRSGDTFFISLSNMELLRDRDRRLLRKKDALMLLALSGLYSLVAICIVVFSYFQDIFLERGGQRMVFDLRLFLFRHILGRSLFFFKDNPLGKLVTRISNDILNISEIFRSMVIGLFKDILSFFGIVAVMLLLNPQLALVCLSVVPLMLFITIFVGRLTKRFYRRVQGYVGKMNTIFQESLAGATAIKHLGAEERILEKLHSLNKMHFRAGRSQTALFSIFLPLLELVASLAIALLLWFGGGSVVQDKLSLGTLVAFISYMQMLQVPIRSFSDKYNHLQGAVTSSERVFAIIDDRRSLSTKFSHPAGSFDKTAGVVFSNVSFAYEREENIFSNLNLEIPPGQIVTIVGPSGGGKSTFVNLIMRLYDPDSGRVSLYGRDLKTIPSEKLTQEVSLVSQEIILLTASVKDNIVLGRSHISHSDFEKALYISGISSWVKDLPNGIHTIIGEGARQLSQGQSQMLSLARALVANPGIIVLDEAFSQIDRESENKIFERIYNGMENKICISVAHRLSTARFSHRIIVMDGGKIIEDGSHEELIAAEGLYAEMVGLSEA